MISSGSCTRDILATTFTALVAVCWLRFWKEIARRRLIDQKLNRKLVHVTVGLVLMLCWPLFSSGYGGALSASLVPGWNIIHMLLLGLGIWVDDGTVKSMTRFGDHRELLKGPLCYATSITWVSAVYWRTSSISIAAICNLCAGDGVADIIGRRFGRSKHLHNNDKSVVGSFAMIAAGFLSSVVYMYYFSWFGYTDPSLNTVLGFLIVSVGSAAVESLPIGAHVDDNITVTIASVLIGHLVL